MPSSGRTGTGIVLGKHLVKQGRTESVDPNPDGNRAERRAAARKANRTIPLLGRDEYR